MNEKSTISKREYQVLNLIAYAHSTKQVSEKLFISYETARSHRQNLLRKLKAGNSAGLVRIAMELGLIQIPYPEAI